MCADTPSETRLGKRGDIRYVVEPIHCGDLGEVVDISRGGMRVRRPDGEEEAREVGDVLSVTLFKKPRQAEVVWQDAEQMGLRFLEPLEELPAITKVVRRPAEIHFLQKKGVSDQKLQAYAVDKVWICLVNLLVEMNQEEPDLGKVRQHIRDIGTHMHEAEGEEAPAEEGGPEEAAPAESEEAEGDAPEPDEPPALGDRLIRLANSAEMSSGVPIKDIRSAVLRLGFTTVKDVTTQFLLDKRSRMLATSAPTAKLEALAILKTVVFNRLRQLLRYQDEKGAGASLLMLDEMGLDMMVQTCGIELEGVYAGPSGITSEACRALERIRYGKDLLHMVRHCFEDLAASSSDFPPDLFDGYVLSHVTLAPQYTLDPATKLTLNRRNASLAFLTSLTLLAVRFILDRDPECGAVLLNRMRTPGMRDTRVLRFINIAVHETNHDLEKYGFKARLADVSIPSHDVRVERYLYPSPASNHFLQVLRDYGRSERKRLAIRHEDALYVHLVLGKILQARDFGLHRGACCVVPCGNLREGRVYFGDLASQFDVLVLKDIDRASSGQSRALIKLWEEFEGQVVATFSTHTYLDFNNRVLYEALRGDVVDFPSGFSAEGVYRRMVEQTLESIRPLVGDREIDLEPYLQAVYTMESVRDHALVQADAG